MAPGLQLHRHTVGPRPGGRLLISACLTYSVPGPISRTVQVLFGREQYTESWQYFPLEHTHTHPKTEKTQQKHTTIQSDSPTWTLNQNSRRENKLRMSPRYPRVFKRASPRVGSKDSRFVRMLTGGSLSQKESSWGLAEGPWQPCSRLISLLQTSHTPLYTECRKQEHYPVSLPETSSAECKLSSMESAFSFWLLKWPALPNAPGQCLWLRTWHKGDRILEKW